MIVDTSVLTRLHHSTVAERVLALRAVGPLHRTSISDLELGYSARSATEWDTIHAHVGAFGVVDVEAHHFRRAAQVQRLLAAAGLRGRSVPDLVIAACAEDRGLPVLHYDADFDHIAGITGQHVECVVPRGSID